MASCHLNLTIHAKIASVINDKPAFIAILHESLLHVLNLKLKLKVLPPAFLTSYRSVKSLDSGVPVICMGEHSHVTGDHLNDQ